ncbi:MAG: DNA polymerase III subunit delta [Bacilli bacterium]|nr:DNA polymerase III subunit delta [Bacilli bacterium]
MKNFYLLYSGDGAILNKEINDLEKKLDISDNDIIYYNIDDIDGIINEASTIGMFSLNKFIIINMDSYFKDKKDIPNINLLENYFDSYNSNSYLVFVCNSDSIDSRKKIVNLIKKYGIVKKLEVNDNYLNDYVNNYLKDNGYKINNGDVVYFINRVGNNINNVTNELDKLMLYKINDKIINRNDIDLLTVENIDDSIYDLVNCILKNDNEKAIKLYNNFIDNGMDVNQIVAIIAAQIRLLYQVKRLYNSGKSNDEIAKILEFKSVYRVKYLLSDSYYYSESDLVKYLSKLADIDNAIKTSNGDGNMLMQLFIVKKDM